MPATCQALPPTSARWRDLGAALAVTAAAALVAAGQAHIATLLVLAPLAEEIVFRAGLQEALLRRHRTARYANASTALAFAAAHVAMRPGLWAGLTLLPALLIGAVYERHRGLGRCVALHAALNAAWLLRAHLHA